MEGVILTGVFMIAAAVVGAATGHFLTIVKQNAKKSKVGIDEDIEQVLNTARKYDTIEVYPNLEINTPEHTKFFCDNYNRDGVLILCVKNLIGWVNEDILSVLKKKSSDTSNGGLVLYVEQKDAKVTDLEDNYNARVIILDKSKTTRFTISIIEVDGSYTVFIRDRDVGSGKKVTIEEILTSPSQKLLLELIFRMLDKANER